MDFCKCDRDALLVAVSSVETQLTLLGCVLAVLTVTLLASTAVLAAIAARVVDCKQAKREKSKRSRSTSSLQCPLSEEESKEGGTLVVVTDYKSSEYEPSTVTAVAATYTAVAAFAPVQQRSTDLGQLVIS